jgi:hypothetical protein
MISNGKEAVTVYKIKASAAGVRSGWYPQPKIISIIGNKVISKKK